MKKYLLFDLDGTLTDPKIGITTCVQYALADQGIEEPDLDKLECFIGPPLRDSFMQFYGFTQEQAEAAVAKYRERYKDIGLFENEVYKGMEKMLKKLHKLGYHLAVASSKPEVYVERILQHFHIAQYFEVVTGSTLDGSRDKKEDVIQEALKRLFGNRAVPKEEMYMIGDRLFDVQGAHMLGIECVAVSYGYGDIEELMDAKADYIVQSVGELEEFLLREQEYDKPKMEPMQRVWQMVYLFLMFMVVRVLAMYVVSFILQAVSGGLSEGIQNLLYVKNAAGEVEQFSQNLQMILTAIGFCAGLAVIYPTAKMMIEKTQKDSYLLHLRPVPRKNYVWMTVAALGLQMGITALLGLLGLSGSAEYQAVSESQFGGNLLLGLLCYGLISPIAEEYLFRGVLYNAMKRFMSRKAAWFISAFLFGTYHGNMVQGVYGFLMGLLMAYAYEYFGSFKWPVMIHVLVNVVAYVLSAYGEGASFIISWPVCIIGLVLGLVAVWQLAKQKKVMR